MPVRPKHEHRIASKGRDRNERKVEWQRSKNNLIGILVAIIVIAFAFDLGGVATSVAQFIFRG